MDNRHDTPETRPMLPAEAALGYFVPAAQLEGREDGLSLAQIWTRIWGDRWIIIATALIITALAAVAAFAMTPIYRAEAILAPVESESSNAGMLGALGALGSLTSAIGLSGELPASNKDEAITIMRSRAFTEKLVEENNLLPILFEDNWNAATESWQVSDADEIPTPYLAFKLFDDELRTISIDSTTGLVTLAIEWKDPDLAAQWVSEHIKYVNELTRNRVVADATKRLAYLNAEAANTNLVGVRQALFSIIEGQYNTIAIAATQEEYVFRTVDPALAPIDAARPKKLLMIAGGLVSGGLLGVALALFRPRRTGKAALPG